MNFHGLKDGIVAGLRRYYFARLKNSVINSEIYLVK